MIGCLDDKSLALDHLHSMAVQSGLCLTWLETLSTCFSHRAHVEHYTFSHGLHHLLPPISAQLYGLLV